MTEDRDFKRLVRERMSKTGESYVTARRQLRPDEPQSPALSGPNKEAAAPGGHRYSLYADDSERAELGTIVTDIIDAGAVEVGSDDVRVWMGDPPSWSAVIPRRKIVSVDRIDDGGSKVELPSRGLKTTWNAARTQDGRTRVISRGAHGWRGKWLVNGSDRNLVRLTMADGVRATVSPGTVLPGGAASRGVIGRFFMKDRTVKLTELIVSVDDPDALVNELRAWRR